MSRRRSKRGGVLFSFLGARARVVCVFVSALNRAGALFQRARREYCGVRWGAAALWWRCSFRVFGRRRRGVRRRRRKRERDKKKKKAITEARLHAQNIALSGSHVTPTYQHPAVALASPPKLGPEQPPTKTNPRAVRRQRRTNSKPFSLSPARARPRQARTTSRLRYPCLSLCTEDHHSLLQQRGEGPAVLGIDRSRRPAPWRKPACRAVAVAAAPSRGRGGGCALLL